MSYDLFFAGKNLSEFGLEWDNKKLFDKPEAVYNRFDVPFRNGDILRPVEKFKNVQIAYRCFINANFKENYSNLVNYLNSFSDYQVLQNSLEADVYRKAVFHSAITPDVGDFALKGWVTLTFDCMPQEFLTSGDTPVNVSNVYKRYTGKTVYIDNPTGQSEVTLFRADFSPKQDLNGYEYPWVGGAGKNTIPVAWTTETKNGVTATANADGTVTLTGTATANATFYVNTTYTPSENMRMTGCPSGGGSDTYVLWARTSENAYINDYGNGVTIPSGTSVNRFAIVVIRGQTVNNLIFKPMIRLASVADDTYEPYSNICPITGWDTIPINTTATSRNLLPSDVLFPETVSGVTFTPNMDYPPTRAHGIITADGTAEDDIHLMIYDGLQLPEGDYILTGCPAQTFYRYFLTLYKNGEIVGSQAGEGMRFVVHSGDSIGVGIGIFNRAELLNVEFKPMIRVDTDTNPTYEPYSEEPIPLFTIDLNGTRYGGHVEATTGVLTVDRVSVIADPSLSWRYASGSGGYFYLSAAFPNLKRNGQVITNLLPTVTTSEEFASTENCVYCATNINIKVNGVNTVSDFQTWLTNNSLQVVYEIEPTTVQLTPQQIELATGMNQFGTDTDGLTVTVREPFTLVNPTLMESKPLIKIEQAGTYYLNGEQIIQTHGSGAVYPMYIDTETMDAYAYNQYGGKVSMNGYVELTAGAIVLSAGENYFYSNARITVTPRWWRL